MSYQRKTINMKQRTRNPVESGNDGSGDAKKRRSALPYDSQRDELTTMQPPSHFSPPASNTVSHSSGVLNAMAAMETVTGSHSPFNSFRKQQNSNRKSAAVVEEEPTASPGPVGSTPILGASFSSVHSSASGRSGESHSIDLTASNPKPHVKKNVLANFQVSPDEKGADGSTANHNQQPLNGELASPAPSSQLFPPVGVATPATQLTAADPASCSHNPAKSKPQSWGVRILFLLWHCCLRIVVWACGLWLRAVKLVLGETAMGSASKAAKRFMRDNVAQMLISVDDDVCWRCGTKQRLAELEATVAELKEQCAANAKEVQRLRRAVAMVASNE